MAGKGMWGDGLSSSVELEGMSKNQLYDFMSQMKSLIEQNQEQSRRILIQNPLLTRALFQAQIMLGMLQPPELLQNVQPAEVRDPQKLAQTAPQPSSQASEPLPVRDSLLDTTTSPTYMPFRNQQHQKHPAILAPPSGCSAPTANLWPLSIPLQTPQNLLQPLGGQSGQPTQVSVSQSSHIPDVLPFPGYSGARPHPLQQLQMSNTSNQMQQPLPATTIPHMPLQPTLTQHSRPPSIQRFHHQVPPQTSSNIGYQHAGHPQMHHSQPMFHSGVRPPPMVGTSFPQAQSALLNQSPPQSIYQGGGSRVSGDFGTLAGNSMHERGGPSWMLGPPDNTTGSQHSGPPSFPSSQMSHMGPVNQPRQPALLAPDLEKALLQQVMSLTQEEINLLPPEQRNQVFQLQQMLRQ